MDYVNIAIAVVSAVASAFAAFKIMELRVSRLEEQIREAVMKKECEMLHKRNEERIEDMRESFAKMQSKLDEMQTLLHKMAAKLKVE